MSREIKAVAFDAYGTLFDVHSVISKCEELFPGRGQKLSQRWRDKQLEYTWLLSLMGRYEDFWRVTERALTAACRAIDLPCDTSTRDMLMNAYLHLDTFAEVKEALDIFSRTPLAILSNGSPKMLRAAVASTGMDGIFDHIISADEVKVYKPSSEVYGLAPNKLGVDRGAIAFVSSNSFDVNGAKAFGMFTCWVNRTEGPADELGFTPDVEVRLLTELAQSPKTRLLPR